MVRQETPDSGFGKLADSFNRKVKELLVVEDDDVLRKNVIKLIGNSDVHADEAARGAETIKALKDKKDDCIILDIGLPDITGFELLKSLKKDITFANHNLVADEVFGEMHLILWRNVLIYFEQSLQNRVLQLFFDSLVSGGFLCLGTKESLLFTEVKEKFETCDDKVRIFRKKISPYAAGGH